MARTYVNLSENWQQVATGRMLFRVEDGNGKPLSFNDVGDDEGSTSIIASVQTTQIGQDEAKPTYAKGVGIKLAVDTIN